MEASPTYKSVGQRYSAHRNIKILPSLSFRMDDYHYLQSGRRYQYKSRVERQIGDLLTGHRIPFIYEKPVAVMDSGRLKIWYPDFSLQYGLLIEYFGVNGERNYIDRTRHKIRIYQANQLDTIPLYPSDIIPNWQDHLVDRISFTLENRLRALHTTDHFSFAENR